MDKCALIRTVNAVATTQAGLVDNVGSGMEALAALRTCIAAVQREKVQLRDAAGLERSSNVDTLEQCLCLVEEVLRDKDREIQHLRDALERSRERKYEEKSCEPQTKDHHYESVAMDVGKDGTSHDVSNANIHSSSGSGQRDMVMVGESKNRATSGGVGVPLPSPDHTDSITELERGHGRPTEILTPLIILASEELGSHISCGNVPGPPPTHATTMDTSQALTAGRLLGWS